MNEKVVNAKLSYRLVLWGLIWVILLYDNIAIYTGFSYIDELYALLFAILGITKCRNYLYQKEYLICWGVFLFFLVYSLVWGVNVADAVWTDFLLMFKPYVVFYSACLLDVRLNDYYKKKLNKWCKILGVLMLPYGLLMEFQLISGASSGPRFTTIVSIIGLLYLYSSQKSKKDILITFVIWTVGFIPMKGKFVGFYALAFFLFYVMGNSRIKINLKYFCMGVAAGALVYYVAYWKFSFYFIEGSQSDTMFARPALFFGAWEILKNYFPFGSGFGSFACQASVIWYSKLYWTLDVTRNSELSYYGLYACDTFFPTLAQCGVAGVALFFCFWWRRIKDFNSCYTREDLYLYKCLFLMFGYFMIESVADTSYVQNRGLYIFMIMAMFMNEIRVKQAITRCDNK